MVEPFNAKRQITAMLSRGWRWSEVEQDMLVHPDDHELCVYYNRPSDRLMMSPKLVRHIELIIPTPPGKTRSR